MRPVAFTVIERFRDTPKAPDQNEDRLAITENFVAVIDGATSSAPMQGISGGIVAAEAVLDAILALPADATPRQFVDDATARLAARIGAWPDRRLSRPSASAVVWSRRRQEVWRIGDCHFRIDDAEYSGEKLVDRVSYEFRCAVLRGRLALGLTDAEREKTVATLQQPFMPLVDVQHAFANADSDDPLAYGVIDGTPVPDRFIEAHPTAAAREIVLCSDGFLSPCATLAEGLADLARIKRDDPLMTRLVTGSRPFAPGVDCFDDTTYVRFALA